MATLPQPDRAELFKVLKRQAKAPAQTPQKKKAEKAADLNKLLRKIPPFPAYTPLKVPNREHIINLPTEIHKPPAIFALLWERQAKKRRFGTDITNSANQNDPIQLTVSFWICRACDVPLCRPPSMRSVDQNQ